MSNIIITEKAEQLIKELLTFKLEEADDPRWALHIIDLLKEEMENSKKLFCYSKPNTMDGYLQNGDCHRYTDDVALCYAKDVEEAHRIFSQLYDEKLLNGNIKEVRFSKLDGIFVATDY